VLFGVLIALPVLGGGVARAVSQPATSHTLQPRQTATTVASATTAPPATLVHSHFEGRHSGIEHFQLATSECPVLDHRLRETFTLTDGTAWSFRAHYCGTIDAHKVWRGAGSFTITTANGSTFSGTFTDSAQLPSVGVPYAIDIETGTGDFAGANGSCVLDNHLRTIAPGTQHQKGIFVCDVDH
jgi:hypothetical protein